MRGVITILSLFLFCFAAKSASAVPPIGERKYLINKNRPEAIIKIVPKNQVTEFEYLRDPIMPGDELPQKKLKPIKKAVPLLRPPKRRFQESEFGLRAMKIRGRQAEPRVKFEMEAINLRPVEELPETNYLENLMESPREAGL